jgi:hypothetical protein
LTLLQSIASAINTVTSWAWYFSTNANYINSLSVSTSGYTVTVTPYSDNALTSPIATEVYTSASAPPIGAAGVGIIQGAMSDPGDFGSTTNSIGPFQAQ